MSTLDRDVLPPMAVSDHICALAPLWLPAVTLLIAILSDHIFRLMPATGH
jgi:hypothetical protein